jgi:predicted NAD/FAD-binding protein
MRIGIIGGGASGLATAWLLNDHHEVTLFERQDRLGGHAHTIEIVQDGERIGIDAGFEFFSDVMFPTFRRLLSILGVTLKQYPLTVTFYTVDNRKLSMLPPVRNGTIMWSAFKPWPLSQMVQLHQTLRRAAPLVEAADWSITIEQFIDRLPLTQAFKDNFLFPFLLVGWGCRPDEFKRFSAYDVLKYHVTHLSSGFSALSWNEVVGGTQAYVKDLIQTLIRTNIKLSADIHQITRIGDSYVVLDVTGGTYEFDHLIIATNAYESRALLAQVDGTEDIRQHLSKIEYFKTTIAVHGDRRLMPAQEKHWSVVNIRYDGTNSANTVWKRWKSHKPIFKSWVTHETQMPNPLYGIATYYHPKVDLNYFQAQQSLNGILGRNNLWLAGMYMYDIDCHESAIMSAINVVQRLEPQSAHLKQLLTA